MLRTLAGSTIMLLTLPWLGSLILGRNDIGPNGEAQDETGYGKFSFTKQVRIRCFYGCAYRHMDRQTETCGQTTDRQTDRHGQTDRHMDRQTWTDRQTYERTDRQTYEQTDI